MNPRALAWLLGCALCAGCMRPLPPRDADAAAAERTADAGALLARGQALLRSGDSVRAEQYLTLAVRAGAPESRAIVPLVQACVGSSRLQSALEHAVPYLRRRPGAWRLRYLVAAIQLALGRTPLAIEELARVRRDRPEAAGPHYLAAVIARDQLGDPLSAADAFDAYVRAAPNGEHAAEARAYLREHAVDGTALRDVAQFPPPATGADR